MRAADPIVITVMRWQMGPGKDPFSEHVPPDGITYQWVRTALCGEPDPQSLVSRVESGWQFVAPQRHRTAVTCPLSEAITTTGLVLMERPTVEVDWERAKERAVAEKWIEDILAQLRAMGFEVEVKHGEDTTT